MNPQLINDTLRIVLLSKGMPHEEVGDRVLGMLGDARKVLWDSMVQSMRDNEKPDLQRFQVKALADLAAWAMAGV